MKARSRARYQLYRKASLMCVFSEKAWRVGGSAPTQGTAETGTNSLNAKIGACVGFLILGFFTWKASICCLLFNF